MSPHRSLATTGVDSAFQPTASTASSFPGTISLVIGLTALVTTATFVLLVWRRRSAPTAKPLLGVSGALFLSAFTYVLLYGLVPLWGGALGADRDSLWLSIVITAILLGTGLWFLFAIQYTGRGRAFMRPAFAGVVILWAIFVFNGAFLALADVGEGSIEAGVLRALTTGLFYISALGVVGALLVLETAMGRNAVRLPEAATLSVAALVFVFAPVVAGNLERTELVLPLLVVSSGAFVVTVRRYPIFETLPAARIAGRDRLVEALDDAVVVVDRAGRVVDLNPAAADAFDTDRESALDRPVDALTPTGIHPAEIVTAETAVTVRTGSGETLAFEGNPVTDDHGRTFGTLLVGRNVTERRRRERRLGVLGHLLTDELREWSDVVADRAASISTGSTDDPAAAAADIRTRTAGMQELVGQVREIERTLAEGEGGRTDLSAFVPEVADSVEIPVTVRTPGHPVVAAAEASVVRTVLGSLLLAAGSSQSVGGLSEEDDLDRQDGLTVDVIATPRHAEIHIVEPQSLAAHESADATEPAAVTIARVAVEHTGGSVSVTRTDSGTARVVVRFPVADGAEVAESVDTEGGEAR